MFRFYADCGRNGEVALQLLFFLLAPLGQRGPLRNQTDNALNSWLDAWSFQLGCSLNLAVALVFFFPSISCSRVISISPSESSRPISARRRGEASRALSSNVCSLPSTSRRT